MIRKQLHSNRTGKRHQLCSEKETTYLTLSVRYYSLQSKDLFAGLQVSQYVLSHGHSSRIGARVLLESRLYITRITRLMDEKTEWAIGNVMVALINIILSPRCTSSQYAYRWWPWHISRSAHRNHARWSRCSSCPYHGWTHKRHHQAASPSWSFRG